ncbi:unnamed protein product, partial [Didymodactylos carnosus]
MSLSDQQQRSHGYYIANRDTVDVKYICPLCRLLIREPVQILSCGDRTCQNCLNSNIGQTEFRCPSCKKVATKSDVIIDRGFKRDIEQLTVICYRKIQGCQWSGRLKDYQTHIDQSHSNLICDYRKERFSDIVTLNEHKLEHCEKASVECPLSKYGCCSTNIIQSEFGEHLLSEQHQSTLLKTLKLSETFSNRSGLIMELEPHISGTELYIDLQKYYQTLNIFNQGVQTLTVDSVRLSEESIRNTNLIQTAEKELSQVKQAIEEKNYVLSGLRPQEEILHQDITSMNLVIEDMNLLSKDGTLIWRTDRISEEMTDAQSGRQASIYSPPFYSSPTGYKMRARLYLNGDGNARHTHMSLFFLLMRGEYDSILCWPFNYKVTFCLFDQTQQNRHVIDSFRPDTKSN